MIAIRHLHRLWGRLWPLTFLPLGFLGVLVAIGGARVEHYVIISIITALALGNRATRNLLVAISSGILIGFGYEMIRFLRPIFVTSERILGCELQLLDAHMFGFGTGLAPPDFFIAHNHLIADFFFALPYTVFWGATIVYALYLYGTDSARLQRFLWILALTHAVAFVIWLWLPAAPPWYVREFGCVIDENASPSAAALGRIDAFFSISYFHEFYSRAPSVFGALPSLHVAFPAAALAACWRSASRAERTVHVALTAWMLAASVYLDHHWLLDGLLTLCIVGVVYLTLFAALPRFDRDAFTGGAQVDRK